LQVLYRLTSDSVEHAIWAGVSAYFIGLAITNGRRKAVLAVTGLVISTVLHGVFDSFGGAVSRGGAITLGLSLFVFLGSAITADVQAVRHNPLFPGGQMVADPPNSLASVEGRS
jgi:RsiW-degrading membrane proteinase PrsW (M82 family)